MVFWVFFKEKKKKRVFRGSVCTGYPIYRSKRHHLAQLARWLPTVLSSPGRRHSTRRFNLSGENSCTVWLRGARNWEPGQLQNEKQLTKTANRALLRMIASQAFFKKVSGKKTHSGLNRHTLWTGKQPFETWDSLYWGIIKKSPTSNNLQSRETMERVPPCCFILRKKP